MCNRKKEPWFTEIESTCREYCRVVVVFPVKAFCVSKSALKVSCTCIIDWKLNTCGRYIVKYSIRKFRKVIFGNSLQYSLRQNYINSAIFGI